MLRSTIFFVFTLNFTYALAECDGFGDLQQYECAKLGDQLASKGDYSGSMKAWKKSCDLGLNSSCEMTTEYKNNEEKFRKDFKVSKELFDCTSGKSNVEKCHQVAVKNIENDPEKSLMMLENQCSNEYLKACNFLGRVFFRNQMYTDAERVYTIPCMNGDKTSCMLLEQINRKIAMQEQRTYRDKQLQLMGDQVEAQRSIAKESRLNNYLNVQRNIQLGNVNNNLSNMNNSLNNINSSIQEGNDIQLERNRWQQYGEKSNRSKYYKPMRPYQY